MIARYLVEPEDCRVYEVDLKMCATRDHVVEKLGSLVGCYDIQLNDFSYN